MGRCYGGVEPEEVPFHCTLSLCHRPDSLKQTLRWGLGWSLFMKAPQLWRGGGKSTRGQNETVKCVAGWTKSLSIPPSPGEPGNTLGLDWNSWDFIPLFSLSHCKGHVFLGWGGFPQLKQTQTKLTAGVQSPSLEWDLGLIHLCIYCRYVYNCLHDQSPALYICKVISGPWLCYKSPLITA